MTQPKPHREHPRQAAHRSSFYAAMRVLPSVRREAMFAIYAFCRAVDDVADGPGDHAARTAELATWRADVDALFAGAAPARLADLVEPVRTFGLARQDFMAIIDGVAMDACSDIAAPDAATLDLYCDRVASAVGRLAVRVFGLDDDDGSALAFHLGRALQLTNILRDIDEDATRGRLYVPRELLQHAGIDGADIAVIVGHAAFPEACNELARQARSHFRQADAIMARHPLAVVRAPTLMAKVYEALLARMMARGFAAPRSAVRAAGATVLWNILRHGLVRRPRAWRRGDPLVT